MFNFSVYEPRITSIIAYKYIHAYSSCPRLYSSIPVASFDAALVQSPGAVDKGCRAGIAPTL